MSRYHLPQSGADRIAAAATAVAIAAVVWVVVAVSPDPRDVSMVAAQAVTARHVDEGSRAAPRETVAALPKTSVVGPAQSRRIL